MNKKIIGVVIFLLILLSTSHITDSIAVKKCQLSLEITVNVTGSGRKYHITTCASNNGDEQLKVMLIYLPGGGFKIYNQNEEIVYDAPKFFFAMTWDLIIDPDQMIEIYSETWKGINNKGINLQKGNYSVRGVVFTEYGYIYSESVDIHLEKARCKHIIDFLNYFPLFGRILNFIV